MLLCSLLRLRNVLSIFSRLSVLKPSYGKSQTFFQEVDIASKVEIMRMLEFKGGNLPVMDLGVPLISSRYRVNDCKALVDKMPE